MSLSSLSYGTHSSLRIFNRQHLQVYQRIKYFLKHRFYSNRKHVHFHLVDSILPGNFPNSANRESMEKKITSHLKI